MLQTIQNIQTEKIIAIVRNVPKEKLLPLCRAMYKGGIRLVECTYDASGATSDKETAAMIKLIADEFGDKMTVGAGTVLTPEQVLLTKEAGGKFIISPDTNTEVIKKTKAEGLVSIPGALTPTEAMQAHRAGADFVKLFPIGRLGAGYLKDLTAPLSQIRFLAVGGVDAENMAEYFKCGACGIGVGSNIINKSFIAEDRWDDITALAKRYTKRIER